METLDRIRVATLQYFIRPVSTFEQVQEQVEGLAKTAADYKCHLLVFPEYFTTQLEPASGFEYVSQPPLFMTDPTIDANAHNHLQKVDIQNIIFLGQTAKVGLGKSTIYPISVRPGKQSSGILLEPTVQSGVPTTMTLK